MSIVAGVITGGIAGVVAEAAGFAASTVSTIANTAAGIAAGATMAGLSGGNPLLGALIGGTFGFLTGGGLTGVQPGADFPVSPALSDAAGSGALFANFLPRGESSGNIVLAAGPGTGKFPNTFPPELGPNQPPPECPLGADDSCLGGNRNPMNVDMQPSPAPGSPPSYVPPCPGDPRCKSPEDWLKERAYPQPQVTETRTDRGDTIYPNGWWIPKGAKAFRDPILSE